ncbi:hypothetical protein GOP47_0021328 [Adiantum capillus-veneris]|uniref:RRM domain-containing protein n=1 Tax=Adiantum capillus-veneris TaxID=13818 RepID=A0A9D4Z701_ADICA|nr:hypothetical protein GOP47_0021328 [Adiantum capillus-veneris]
MDSEDIISLDKLRSGQSAPLTERDADEASLDCMDTGDMKSFDDLKSDQWAPVAESESVIGRDADEAWLDCMDTCDMKSFDALKSDQWVPEAESDAAELGCMDAEDSKSVEDLNPGPLASIIGNDAGEAYCIANEDIFNLTDTLRKKGKQDASDQEFLELLEQTNSKETAMKKTAPLIELLQQTASGSRRVHLSAWKGVEKDVSWANTLLSIRPSSLNNKQEVINDDMQSCTNSNSSEIGKALSTSLEIGSTLSISPKMEANSSTTLTSLSLTSTEVMQDVHGAHKLQYGVKLVAKIRGTVLTRFSSSKLRAELKRTSIVFSDLQDKVDRIQAKDAPIHAILYFKTEKGKMDALNLKTLVIQDETLFLEGLTGVAVEEKSRADLGSASLSKETSIPDLPALENSTSDVTAECFDFSKQRHFWNLSVQNSIIIEDYPMKVPLKSIYDFFSVFGELQMFYGKGTIFIKFKDECDKEKALKVHQFVVDGCSFRIKTDVSSDELVIRLYSVKVEADKMKAMNACSKYGSIKYINHDRIGVLFAHYKVTEKQRAKEILNSLRKDKDLKRIWDPILCLEGFKHCSREIVAEDTLEGFQSCSRDVVADDIKRLLNLSRELLKQVEKMYADQSKDVSHCGD